MIKELVNFSKTLSQDFKKLAIKPREGLHILLDFDSSNGTISINEIPKHFEIYSKKMEEETDFIKECKMKSQNAWCVNTNKCFDLPTKAIHTCSPIMVAFKREHLKGGYKYVENEKKGKTQIKDRFGLYFGKSLELVDESSEKETYKLFQHYFESNTFSKTLAYIEVAFEEKRVKIQNDVEELKLKLNATDNREAKERLKQEIKDIEKQLLNFKNLDDADYLLFYLNLPLENYIKPHSNYLADKLFNTDKYNVEDNTEGLVYGTSDYMNGFNANMPFLMHQTSPFDITGRISNEEARELFEFDAVIKGKILPNPLPVFIFKEELQSEYIAFFKESGFRSGYKEIIEKIFENPKRKADFGNYYLLNWANTKDGIVFNDFDYVSAFEYDFPLTIEGLFGKESSYSISNIFHFQHELLPIIFNNNLIVKTKDKSIIIKYFDEIEAKYCKSALNHTLILKYRKAIYEFIYKSRRSAFSNLMFHDIMKTSILEDIRLDKMESKGSQLFHSEKNNIERKLNIWFSLYEQFETNKNDNKTMASKLKDYQDLVEGVISKTADSKNLTDPEFMFLAGQVVEYLLSKSKSADNSYKLLEPYLQKTSVKEFKKAISVDFAKYKHENFSKNFEAVAAEVLTYETDANLRDLMPELLAGIFSKNQLFSNNIKEITNA
jgi:CRISPR-associated protein Csh1